MDKQKVLQLLSDFVAIESVSTDQNRFDQIEKAVAFLKAELESMEFTVTVAGKKKMHPLIIAEKKVTGAKQTIGIYGHYDVQPEDPVSEWKTQPFVLTRKNGKLYGRGVADNKGHVVQNFTAVNSLIEEKNLKNNIVFVLEGEEETGSVHFRELVEEAHDILSKVDVFFVTDVGMYKKSTPQIFYALRGLVYFQIDVTIGERDLHSGIYGNRVLNPVQVLSDLFARMKDVRTGEVLIPGFYDQVRTPDEKEMSLLQKTVRSDEEEKAEAQVYAVTSLRNIPSTLASKLFPSLDVHGFLSGYTDEGQKTVIPRQAMAKFSCRLVENQEPEQIIRLIQEFIKKNIVEGVKYDVKVMSKDVPFYTGLENLYMKKVVTLLEKEFGVKPLFNRSGGSIPASAILQSLFGTPVILTGFTLPDDNIHSPNENFDEEMFWKGIEVLRSLYLSL